MKKVLIFGLLSISLTSLIAEAGKIDIKAFQQALQESAFVNANIVYDAANVNPDGGVVLKGIRYEFESARYDLQMTLPVTFNRDRLNAATIICKRLGFQKSMSRFSSYRAAITDSESVFIDSDKVELMKNGPADKIITDLHCI